ncbi:MAG: hypothetical protein IIB54_05645 [Planctomycetes bacterium]|nr:hypothetical protein [Planctomycetota bacterium]
MLASFISARRQSLVWLRVARWSIGGIAALFTIASAALLTAFLNNQFQFEAVLAYSERALPAGYKLAAFWAGQEGSLLLWAWILSILCLLAVIGFRRQTGADQASKDALYQLYLTTLPDLSVSKHHIHRKKTKGFSQDALRSFAHQNFHGSYMLARLRHVDILERGLVQMKENAQKSKDPDKAADFVLCDQCSMQRNTHPGALLCGGCLHNKEAIAKLKPIDLSNVHELKLPDTVDHSKHRNIGYDPGKGLRECLECHCLYNV